MDKQKVLVDFLRAVATDNRISAGHISLFTSLWNKWNDLEGSGCLVFFSYEIRPLCKISSSSTFHKTIRQLHEYGYIAYSPSMNHFKGSEVRFFEREIMATELRRQSSPGSYNEYCKKIGV